MAFEVRDGRWFQPKSGAKRLPVVFVVSERSTLPLFSLALQAAGPFDGTSLLRTTTVPLPEDMEAMRDLFGNFRYALCQFCRAPIFTHTALLTLELCLQQVGGSSTEH